MKICRHILPVLFCLTLLGFRAQPSAAQLQAPGLLCADVQPDGSVILTWSAPPNVPVGANYKIFRDTGDGNGFQPINTVGPETATTYQDGLIDASQGTIAYSMKTIAGDESPMSNVVYTLYLSLNSSNLSSVADLTWNHPFTTPPQDGHFVVYRNINGGGYAQVASLPAGTVNYRDTLYGLCSSAPIPIYYKVSFERDACEMFSQESMNEFQDLLGPTPPRVETVLINPATGDAEVYWYPSQAPDLAQYLIQSVLYQSGTTVYLNAGFVAAAQPTQFVYNEPNPGKPTNLVVIAFDSCGNDQSFSNIYSTIYTKTNYADCSQSAEISWTPYTGWPEGVTEYAIHVSQNGGADAVVATVSGDTTKYMLSTEPNAEYCVYVEARSGGPQRPSTSNQSCFETKYPEVIDFNYLQTVTVRDKSEIEIDLYQDLSGEGTTYELFRSKDGGAFKSMGQYVPTTDPVLTIVDTDVNADMSQYTYKWKAFDGCGVELPESNIGKNILLVNAPVSESLVNSISWSGYASWDGGVQSYQVYRKTGSETEYSLHATLGPNTLHYQESIADYITEGGEFCYKIVAIEGANQYDASAKSESNVLCITQEPYMWVPNAIVLNGYNKIFKPVAGFIDFSSYRMEIYNKWGQRIFSSEDINDGWDGKVNGHPAREDYYRYIIAYRDGSGKPYVTQGVLYVLKDT